MWYYHFDPESIRQLFDKKKWQELALTYSPAAVARHLGLANAIVVALELFHNDEHTRDLQEYALTLLYVLKGMYAIEWDCESNYTVLLQTVGQSLQN